MFRTRSGTNAMGGLAIIFKKWCAVPKNIRDDLIYEEGTFAMQMGA